MSKYTTELRYICEVESGAVESKGYQNINEILELARANIFNFDYPIFDEEYRPVLEKKILKHYYTREICAETVGLWKLFLERKMQEIMPYYNKLYETETLEFNPLYDVDYTKTGNREGEKTGTTTDNSNGSKERTLDLTDRHTITNNDSEAHSGNDVTQRADGGTQSDRETTKNVNDHWDYYSDTPQGSVGNLNNLTYLTNARHITDDTDGSTSTNTTTFGKTETDTTTHGHTITDTKREVKDGTHAGTDNEEFVTTRGISESVNNTDEYLERIYGKMPGTSYAKLITEYRDSLLNIDMMIIKELRNLFFNLW